MGCMAHCGHCDHAIAPRPDACSPPLPPGREDSRTTPGEIANLTSRSDSLPVQSPPEAAGLTHPFPSASIAARRPRGTPAVRRGYPHAHSRFRTLPHTHPHAPTLAIPSSLWHWASFPLAAAAAAAWILYVHFLLLGALSWSWSRPRAQLLVLVALVLVLTPPTHPQAFRCTTHSSHSHSHTLSHLHTQVQVNQSSSTFFFPSLDPSTAIFVSTHPTSSLCPISPYFTSPSPSTNPTSHLPRPQSLLPTSSQVQSSTLQANCHQSVAVETSTPSIKPSDHPVSKEHCDVGPIRQVISAL